MFTSEPGSRLTLGSTEKLSPTGWPGVGYGSWPTYPHVVEWLGERAQHVLPGWQVALALGDLLAQERAHLTDLIGDWFKGVGPPCLDDLAQRLRHETDCSAREAPGGLDLVEDARNSPR
jgi:hypothetical protein